MFLIVPVTVVSAFVLNRTSWGLRVKAVGETLAENMVSGRGFIALVAVIFGRWRPTQVVLGCLFFGVFEAVTLQASGWGLDVPSQLLNAVPYPYIVPSSESNSSGMATLGARRRSFARRARLTRRRSSSVRPPQIPSFWNVEIANSRHS